MPRQRPCSTRHNDKQPSNHEHHQDDHRSNVNHHSHGPFGHSHSHENGHSHSHGGQELIAALSGSGDRGSQITLVGLYSNILLTSAKGLAGWQLHSASLLADAVHSLSDLLGDFVTLFCWRLSRGQATAKYPYGFAKFETLGTTAVSLLLIVGAVGIGFHSLHLLVAALEETSSTLAPGTLQQVLQTILSFAAHLPVFGHSHAHMHTVDPNAAWFAAISVFVKEWLYRITKKVADDESSPVLLANAIHHRSDAYSSLVAFVAIIGSWLFPKVPLDPIGGLLVSFVILRQGLDILVDSWRDLTDASVASSVKKSLEKSLSPLLSTSSSPSRIPDCLSIYDLRARRAGAQMFVDLTVVVPATTTVECLSELEEKIVAALKNARREVADVRVKFTVPNT
ncbi:hypothetical protein M378DRAFT_186084 [Amanita muscaria Koide BX008]|uniref:Uncharacterized protein n=1 Tax=Amanita muscaria (strain Koide BX008) TaxID=946122 RepID=A0A0C2SSG8_AMAMK|nr:hypothetical protein M378DRAFT_186084 [Amanita muscaria Koide BX008]